MRIVDVQAYAIRAPNPAREAYWGRRAWVLGHPAGERGGAPATAFGEYPARWRMRALYSEHFETTVVKVTTDQGVVGWGEGKAPVAPEATREIVHHVLRPVLLGADPTDVEVLWERMYSLMRMRGHTTGFFLEAISGVDIALWDILGKVAGLPVCKLLGGMYTDRVRVYASSLPGLRDPGDRAGAEGLARQAIQLVERGFKAIKLGIGSGVEADVKTVEAVRQAVGPEVLLFTDAGGNYDVPRAIALGRALEPLKVGWLEAPLPPEQVDGYAQVAHALALPVASDLIISRYQTHHYLSQRALDVVQPDVCRSGGLSDCKKIADLADVYGVAIAPHVSIGSAIQFAATAHFAAAIPNLLVSEYWIGENPLGNPILREPLSLEGGHLRVPLGPGLGIEVNEAALLAYAG